MTPEFLTALVGAGSALLVASLGALGGYFASRRQSEAAIMASRETAQAAQVAAREQIRASTIVASRQRWIDELRSELSKLIGVLLQLQITLELGDDEHHKIWIQEVIAASALEGKIALMLNPNEEEHENLVIVIRAALNEIRNGKEIDWGKCSTDILNAGRIVLKSAWDQIKDETDIGLAVVRSDAAVAAV